MLKIYKRKYKKSIIYYVKDKDTIILKYLLKYNIKNNKVYFKNLSKVTKILDSNHINYIIDNNVVIYEDNKYNYIIERYNLLIDINNKLHKLIERRKFNKIVKEII